MSGHAPWLAALPETLPCERCSGVERVLQPQFEGSSKTMGYYCPCCRSFLRTIELLTGEHEHEAHERGITPDALAAEKDALAKQLTGKPTDHDMAAAEEWAAAMARDWKPVCPHDTENPWAA